MYADRTIEKILERRKRARELRAKGMTYREIAEKLNIHYGTAWGYVNRGKDEPSNKDA